MKKIIVLSVIILLNFNVKASDTTILFRKINYSDVFKTAKQEKKPVFLYFHFDGCGGCVKMEKTVLHKKEVADYMNNNFVCFEINTLEKEGEKINKIYNIRLQPSFMFLDENEKLLTKIVGVFTPEEFIKHAQDAINPMKSMSYYKSQYEFKKNDVDFLYEYIYLLRDANELKKSVIDDYLNTQSDSNLTSEKNIKLIYEFALNHFVILIPFDSRAYNIMLNNVDKFSKYFDKDQIDVRLVWIAYHSLGNVIKNKDEILFDKIISVLKKYESQKTFEFHEMDGGFTGVISDPDIVHSAQLSYYYKTENKERYNEVLKEYLEKNQNNSVALNSIAWDYFNRYEDKENLLKAVEWVKKSIAISSNYANNDTYANLLFKLEDYENAQKIAEKAIELAKLSDSEFKDTMTLLKQIKIKRKHK